MRGDHWTIKGLLIANLTTMMLTTNPAYANWITLESSRIAEDGKIIKGDTSTTVVGGAITMIFSSRNVPIRFDVACYGVNREIVLEISSIDKNISLTRSSVDFTIQNDASENKFTRVTQYHDLYKTHQVSLISNEEIRNFLEIVSEARSKISISLGSFEFTVNASGSTKSAKRFEKACFGYWEEWCKIDNSVCEKS